MKNLKLPNVTIPRFLEDLFGDLRDRRLLPLIGVLAVGTLAVPFALSDSGSEPSEPVDPGATAVEAPGGDSAGSPLTVVANGAGLRDYRRRLGDDPEDPFRQHFTSPMLEGSELGGGANGPTTEIGGSGSGSGGSESGGTGEEPIGHGEPGEPPLNEGESGDGQDPEPPAGPEEPEPAFVVTLRVSSGEETTTRKLSEPTVLPSEDNPVAVFRGLNKKGNKVVFRTSSSVSAVFGDANCLKGTDRCELLEVGPDSPLEFVYGEETERIFRLTVVDIEHNR
jgi:hypothetical protein